MDSYAVPILGPRRRSSLQVARDGHVVDHFTRPPLASVQTAEPSLSAYRPPGALRQMQQEDDARYYDSSNAQGTPYGLTPAQVKPRFGKWGRWIEEKQQRRREIQQEEKAAGLSKSSSWSLPGQDDQGAGGRSASPLRRDPSALRRDEEAERSLSRDHLVLVTSADATAAAPSSAYPAAAGGVPVSPLTRGRARTNSSASAAAAVQPLTRHTRIERVGERFSTGLPEQPLCGCPLPIGSQGATGRFTLIGTQSGLYVLDAQPHAGIALSAASGDSAARHHCLWTGLGVHQIETYAETDPYAETPRGLVLALVESASGSEHLEMRMWNLASIVNLVKWRVYSATSVVLSLEPEATATPTHGRSRSAFGGNGTNSPIAKRGTKRWSSASSWASSIRTNGLTASASNRYPAMSSSPPTGSRPHYTAADSDLDSLESPATPHSSASHLALGGGSGTTSRPRSASETSHLELPLSWAQASVGLPISKSAGSIQFFRVFRRPPPKRRPKRNYHDPDPSDDEDDSDDEWSSARPQLGGTDRVRPMGGRHHLFLFVATTRSIFLYESEPVERRTWHLAQEYFAPSTPRFLHLLRSSPPELSPDDFPELPTYLSFLLGTSHHLVTVMLSDSTVTELKIPGTEARQNGAEAAHSGTAAAADPKQSGGATANRKVQRSKSQYHRKASPSLAASLRDLNASVSRLFDGGDRNLPAGLRGVHSDFVKGRVVSEDGHEGAQDAAEAACASQSHTKWIGCGELRLDRWDGPRRDRPQLLLLSNQHTSYLVALLDSATAEASTLPSSAPLSPVLLHTFQWAASAGPIVRVSAHVSPDVAAGPTTSHLSLVAFTSTGTIVTEHILSHPALAEVGSSTGADSSMTPTHRVVLPVPISVPTLPQALHPIQHEDPDLSDRAAFDFGRRVGRICAAKTISSSLGAAGWTGSRNGEGLAGGCAGAQGVYFWVQGRAEWSLKRLVCGESAAH